MAVAVEVPSQPVTRRAPATRIPALDGIRGLAISLILWLHATPSNFPKHPALNWIVKMGGFSWSGVDLFFVLSGFLIGGILLDAAESPNYFRTFYIRRAYRILPLYALLLLMGLAIERTVYWLPQYVLMLQNFWMAFIGTFGISALSMTWSLAIEEQFYLTLPLVIRFTPRRRLVVGLASVIALAPLVRWIAYHAFAYHGFKGRIVAMYALTPCRADGLCYGVLAALAFRTPCLWSKLVERRKYVYAALALCAIAGLVILLGKSEAFPYGPFGLGYSFVAAFYCLLLVSVLLSARLSRIFSWAPLRGMGIIAYGVYLFHGAFIDAFRWLAARLFSSHLGYSIAAPVAVVAVIPLAALSWKFFEKPLIRIGHRRAYQFPEKPVSVTLH
jgi:peptidoglycan/LPS O-acetylase OafA/YrhL